MGHRRGTGLVLTGLLLIAAALFLLSRNLLESRRAEETTEKAAAALHRLATLPTGEAYEETQSIPLPETQPPLPMEMPTKRIDGREYIGTLQIPGLDLTMGILSRCSEEGLKHSPCRYVGSAYSQDMVIAAHNYDAHFGRIHRLQPGDAVIFTDVDGNSFSYRVVLRDTLMGDAVAEMTESDFALTLFTCTPGGAYRVTVRCDPETGDA